MRFSLFGKRKKKQEEEVPLETGWQLYASPTTLDPPGTVFRIDGSGKRFIYERLQVDVEKGPEAAARIASSIETKAGVLARFLGLDVGARAGVGHTSTLEFEITEPEHEVTTDTAIRKVVRAFLKRLEYSAGNRYFLIRESRSATAMKYRLADQLLAEMGGQAAVAQAATAGATLGTSRQGTYELVQKFPQRMRVMFLAEEIRPVSAGLAGEAPELGLVPVNEVLVWEEG